MQGDVFITYRSVAEVNDVHVRFIQDKIDTMEKVFRFAVRQHGQKSAVGTREILAEEDEMQPNGRIFKKFVLGDYQWRTFSQMDSEAENFGRGMRELGINAKDNVVLFAETRAEWLIAANGCMKQNFTLVTLYATLGEDALIHGINETEDSSIIMYTSGSTGPPKGVLMSHRNLMSAMLAYTNVATIYEDDVYMAYLPLAHVLELLAESMCMLFGIPIGYSTPLTMTDKSSKIKRGSQ